MSRTQVAPAEETLLSALKRAGRLTATPGMSPEASEAARARKRAAQQLDALTKALTNPLATYVGGFPSPTRLHPFERALLDLTVGGASYERTLLRIDALRKGALELGKGHAGCVVLLFVSVSVHKEWLAHGNAAGLHTRYANRAQSAQEAESRRKTGFQGARLRHMYARYVPLTRKQYRQSWKRCSGAAAAP